MESVTFEVTSFCNARCPHCYIINDLPKSEYLDFSNIRTAVEKSKEIGCINIMFTGGEPMLHPNILELIEYARKLRFAVTLKTNGSLLTKEIIDRFAEWGNVTIHITVQSHIPAKHDNFFGIKGLHENVIEISRYIVAKEVLPIFWMHNFIRPYNKDFPALEKLADEIGVTLLKSPRINKTRSGKKVSDKFQVTEEDFKEVFADPEFREREREDIENATKAKIAEEKSKPYANEFIEKRGGALCNVGLSSLTVLHNGDIVPCLHWHNRKLGNIYEDDIRDVWLNNPFLNELRKLTAGDVPICNACAYKPMCSKCLAENELSTGDYRVPDPEFCAFTKLLVNTSGLFNFKDKEDDDC